MTRTKNVYALPINLKELTEARSHPKVHFAHFKHAIDFRVPEGTKVLASRGGEVIDIKADSKKGGINPKFNDIKYLNYMTLKHSNGEYSQYLHLKYKGAFVKVGDRVAEGQPIALSGNTGFSTEPHLHFQVFRLTKSTIGWETLAVRFKQRIKVNRKDTPLSGPVSKELKKYRRGLGKI